MRFTPRRLLVVSLVLGTVGCAAAPRAGDYQLKGWKLQVSLVPEKSVVMPGEPIYLSFTVRNGSTEDLQVLVGGDTLNWLGRPETFKIQAARDDGSRVPTPDSPKSEGSSLQGPRRIPANGTYTFSLFLPDWAEFKEPGNYTVTATRTLEISKFSQDMSWRDPANVSRLDVQALGTIVVVPLDHAALGDVIVARSRAMLGPDEEAARAAAKALAAINDERAIGHFVRALAESGYPVKSIAVRALGKFGDEAALAAVKQATHDSDLNIRLTAAFSLSRSPNPAAIPALIDLRASTDWGVRNTVLQTLAKMRSPESLELIREMTNDEDDTMRAEARRYLKLRTDASKPSGDAAQ